MVPLEAYSQQPWSRDQWKRLVRQSVNNASFCTLLKNASTKSSLKYLRPDLLTQGNPHPIWSHTRNSIRNLRAAAIRVKLLTGTYPLQRNLRRNRQEDSAVCKLCGGAEETTQHFLLFCPATEAVRKAGIQNLLKLIKSAECDVPETPLQWCRLLLNGIPERVESSQLPRFQNSRSCRVDCSSSAVVCSSRIDVGDSADRDRDPQLDLVRSFKMCSACLTGQCKKRCEVLCKCRLCFTLYERTGQASNNLCFRLHAKRSELLGLQAADQGAPKGQEEPP